MNSLSQLIITEVEYQRWLQYDAAAYHEALGSDEACRRYFWKTWDQFFMPDTRKFDHDWNSE